jgi:hypothetical protein
MNLRHRLRRERARTCRAAAGLLLGLSAAVGAAAHDTDPHRTVCTAVRGMLVPDCNGAICNQGKVTGDLQGRFTSRVTSMYPAGSGWLYSSFTRIELDGRKGTLDTLNEGSMPFDAKKGFDSANATEVMTFSEGTGAYQDYAGTIVVVGAHALGRPTPYQGRLCRRISPS